MRGKKSLLIKYLINGRKLGFVYVRKEYFIELISCAGRGTEVLSLQDTKKPV